MSGYRPRASSAAFTTVCSTARLFAFSLALLLGASGCTERPQAPEAHAPAGVAAQGNAAGQEEVGPSAAGTTGAPSTVARPDDRVHAMGKLAGPQHGGPSGLPPGHPPVPGAAPPSPGLPPGHPPIDAAPRPGRPAAPALAAVPTDEDALPLPLTGIASAAEMQLQRDKLPAGEAREQFERAFRLTFTVARSRRNPAEAKQLLGALAQSHPTHAGVYRTRGYVHIDGGFQVDAALADYSKAVELDPEYGEAHYALAFTYAIRDAEKGKAHYERAMELGIEDARGIGQQFYGGQAPAAGQR